MAIHLHAVAHFERMRIGARYDRLHRFLTATSAYLGWMLGLTIELPETTYALWVSLLAEASQASP